jgi:hypothetical protein
MNRIAPTLGLALAIAGAPAAAQPPAAACQEFEELVMTLEQNATDGDTEVVFFAKTETDGLRRLLILGPGGRRVAGFDGDKRSIGIREFVLESAEPPELDRVLRSFPEGTYTFLGRTVGGDCVVGESPLSHDLAPATSLLTPAEEAVVELDDLLLSWAAVAGAERYVVELNNEDTGSEFTFEVFPPTTSLLVPAALLAADSEYQFAVGVKMPDGNVTFVELAFFTEAP